MKRFLKKVMLPKHLSLCNQRYNLDETTKTSKSKLVQQTITKYKIKLRTILKTTSILGILEAKHKFTRTLLEF